MQITEETKELAGDILAYWEKFGTHEQDTWVGDEADNIKITRARLRKKTVPVCNSSMCAAGTAVFLTTTKRDFMNMVRHHQGDDPAWIEKGGKALGLTKVEAQKLFYSDNTTSELLLKALADGDQERWNYIIDYEYDEL